MEFLAKDVKDGSLMELLYELLEKNELLNFDKTKGM